MVEGVVISINGPIIKAKGMDKASMYDLVEIGDIPRASLKPLTRVRSWGSWLHLSLPIYPSTPMLERRYTLRLRSP